MKIITYIKNLFVKEKPKAISRPLTDDEFNEIKSAKEKKLNSILEKISKSGFCSLSNHERNFLENYGK